MKTRLTLRFAAALLLLSTLNPQLSAIYAQGTAFTYQGLLKSGGSPANGLYDLQLALFDAATSGNQAGDNVTNAGVGVTNGLFTTTIDFGPVFTGTNYWLQIGVRTNGGDDFTALGARQPLTPVPYAIYSSSAGTVANDSITSAGIASGQVVKNLNGLMDAVTLAAGANVSITPNGNTLTIDSVGTIGPQGPPGSVTNAWDISGNAGTSPTDGNFVGTTDESPLEFDVNSVRALRLEPGGNGLPNLIGGSSNNAAADGVSAASIGGGDGNTASGDYATVPGGSANTAGGTYSFAAGQQAQATNQGAFVWADSQNAPFASTNNDSFNVRARGGVRMVTGDAGMAVDGQPVLTDGSTNIQAGNIASDQVVKNVNGLMDTVILAAGTNVTITTNGNTLKIASVGTVGPQGPPGGSSNAWSLMGNAGTSPTNGDFIGTTDNQPLELRVNNQRLLRLEPATGNMIGGTGSTAAGQYAVVGGGLGNSASNSATVGGGVSNSAAGPGSFVGGGGWDAHFYRGNTASGSDATIGGGYGNTSSGDYAIIGGGSFNQATNLWTTVPGGNANIAGGAGATVGGGLSNSATNDLATVGGGANNTAGYWATVGGGNDNTASRLGSTVGGGAGNTSSGDYSTTGGGTLNLATNAYATVSGGNGNTAGGRASTVGGGLGNQAGYGGFDYATVSGGVSNTALYPGSFVGGGGFDGNSFGANIAVGAASTIGGGYANTTYGSYSTVGGGYSNIAAQVASFVGGGYGNGAINAYAALGGGISNSAAGDASFIGGGKRNQTTSAYATVPGGNNNIAGGVASFAAGASAQANHDHSFVWGDGSAIASDNAANQFQVLATGGVGLYTGSANVNIVSSGQMTFGSSTRQMIDLFNFNGIDYGIGVQSSTLYLRAGSTGGFAWYSGGAHNNAQTNSGGGTTLMTLDGNSGNLVVKGTVTANTVLLTSDRNAKENFVPVNSRDVLEKVTALPVTKWNYLADQTVEHIGPMAQDFQAAFGLNGQDDKHISVVDEGGVALAAIQGLDEKVESGEQKAETRIEKLETENAELKARLERLEQLVKNGGAK